MEHAPNAAEAKTHHVTIEVFVVAEIVVESERLADAPQTGPDRR